MEDFGDHNDTRYREGIYVGTVILMPWVKALFPFGCGGYTTFSITNAERLFGGSGHRHRNGNQHRHPSG